jgi:hypothetical protein
VLKILLLSSFQRSNRTIAPPAALPCTEGEVGQARLVAPYATDIETGNQPGSVRAMGSQNESLRIA